MGAKDSPAVAKAIVVNNLLFSHYILIVLAAIVASFAVYRIVTSSIRYIRFLTCLKHDTQQYFKFPDPTFGRIKKDFVDAPLFKKRHSTQMHAGPVEMGILPTRFQTLLLTAIIAMNVVLCAYGIEWNGPSTTKLKHLRNRSGTLAVVNMIPLVLMAGRNNPLIILLNITFDTFNLMHRWFGRIVVALVVTHAVAAITEIVDGNKKTTPNGFVAFSNVLAETRFILYGFIAFIAMVTIILQSGTAVRHTFYEAFWHIHVALVSLILATLWVHLAGLPQMDYLKAVIAIWVIERAIRLFSLLYRNLGGTKADVQILPGDAMRVTLRLARPWTFKPGQHVFLTIPSIGLWTNHPFSVAWSEAATDYTDPEKGFKSPPNSDALSSPQSSISLIIRRRNGFTDRLWRKAGLSHQGRLSLPAIIEGPYSGNHALQSYGTVMLFAGGIGITHQVPFVRDLIAGYAAGTVAARRVLLIWIIRSPEHLEWIRPWMTDILAMHKRRDVLRIQLFVSRPRSTKEIHSPSATVQMFPGKPDIDALVEAECRDQIGAMGVSVCGPGRLGDDVRMAVRKRQRVRNVDFLEESFGW